MYELYCFVCASLFKIGKSKKNAIYMVPSTGVQADCRRYNDLHYCLGGKLAPGIGRGSFPQPLSLISLLSLTQAKYLS